MKRNFRISDLPDQQNDRSHFSYILQRAKIETCTYILPNHSQQTFLEKVDKKNNKSKAKREIGLKKKN